MADLQKTIGERIREYRKKRNLTQEELADKANLHPTFIAHIELGKKVCSINTLDKICRALNISIVQIFEPAEKTPKDADALTKKLLYSLSDKPDIDKNLLNDIAKLIYQRDKKLGKR